MSQIRNRFFGAGAVALILGAVQLASGQDLVGARHIASADSASTTVNRAAKADRAGQPRLAPTPAHTVSFRLNDLAETSVLVRVPVTQEAREIKLPPARRPAGASDRPTIACEAMVSVLTDVAKLLQPGRCVT